ncbi:hypothetical protein lerEdw1_009693 [Lerista edwardsae]|nr:hypothetical protein lerEdw1_009693 [Lerista edwardsae]
MHPSHSSMAIQRKMPYRVALVACNFISFLLLTISLLSPSWLEIIVPENGVVVSPEGTQCNQLACSQLSNESNYMTAARILLILAGFTAAISLFVSCPCFSHYKGFSSMLVSSAASFTTGALGFATIALSTMVDISQKEMSSAGHLRVMWSFGLACLVFTLYIMNGFLSLIMHLLYLARRIEWRSTEISLEGGLPQPAAGDSAAVGLSVFLPSEAAAYPARNRLPSASICFNKTFL